MSVENFHSILSDIIRDLKEIERNFPNVYNGALEALRGKRVKKYLIFDSGLFFFVVVGEHADYFVSLDIKDSVNLICTCKDFLYNIISRKYDNNRIVGAKEYCYHSVAVLLSFLAELAYQSGHPDLREYRIKEYLPELIMEKKEFVDIVFDSVIQEPSS